eukprot:m.152010 g.152010  ORF g.152010 m.152010 type:complete len:503 (-) comp17879_c0_seq3:351-1859(-)
MAFYDEWAKYMREHIWVPIVVGGTFLLLLAFIIWRCCCNSNKKGYASLLPSTNGDVTKLNYSGYGSSAPADRMRPVAMEQDSTKQAASIRCQYFLRANLQFKLLRHLDCIGSRVAKSWFVIKPMGDVDQLMTMIEPAPTTTLLPITPTIRQALRDLYILLQHPYVMTMSHLDLLPEQKQVVVLHPLCIKGSVKDLIHRCNPIAAHERKYRARAGPLPLKRVAHISRHVLEALMFLKERKYTYRSLHSGNVLFHNGMYRLCGLEGIYFGHLHPQDKLIHKALEKIGGDPLSWDYDVICFGRLLFEMALGYTLKGSLPDVEQLVGKCEYQVIEVLVLIFFHPDGRVPSVQELAEQPLFQSIRCTELQRYLPPIMVHTNEIKSILKAGRKQKSLLRRQSIVQRKGSKTLRASDVSETGFLSPTPASSAAVSPVATPVAVSSPPARTAPPLGSDVSAPPPSTAAPPPPPAPAAEGGDNERNALLAGIRRGSALRPTTTVDKSGPML